MVNKRLGGLPAPREAIKRDNDLTPSRACVASVTSYCECMGMRRAVRGRAESREGCSEQGVCERRVSAGAARCLAGSVGTRAPDALPRRTPHSTLPHTPCCVLRAASLFSTLTHIPTQYHARLHALHSTLMTDSIHNQGDVDGVCTYLPTAYDDQLRYCEIIFNKMFNMSTDFK